MVTPWDGQANALWRASGRSWPGRRERSSRDPAPLSGPNQQVQTGPRRRRAKMAPRAPRRSRALASVPEAERSPAGARAGAPRPEPGSRGAGAGEGRPDVTGAAISCFSAVFPSFGWWPLLGFGFPLAEGEAAWTAAPAPRALPPAASRPPACSRAPSPPLLSSAPGRRRRRGPASGPNAGHQVCGGGRRVSAGAAGGDPGGTGSAVGVGGRAGARARVGPGPLPGAGAGRGPPPLSGTRRRAPGSGFFPLFGGGGNCRRRPEGKVNSTLRFLPAPADRGAERSRRRSASRPRSPAGYVG